MLWKLPAPVRSLILSNCRRYSSTSSDTTTREPLRILFCGSDDFSIASLRKLLHAQRDAPGLIESIDVVHRPAKPTGRGLKELRQGKRSHPFHPFIHCATLESTVNANVCVPQFPYKRLPPKNSSSTLMSSTPSPAGLPPSPSTSSSPYPLASSCPRAS